jgi:hypothetical protein
MRQSGVRKIGVRHCGMRQNTTPPNIWGQGLEPTILSGMHVL